MSIINRLITKLSTHAEKTVPGDCEYFQAAILKFADTHDQATAIAALAAAKRATGEQRRRCVEFMVRVAYPYCDEETLTLLDELRHEN